MDSKALDAITKREFIKTLSVYSHEVYNLLRIKSQLFDFMASKALKIFKNFMRGKNKLLQRQ